MPSGRSTCVRHERGLARARRPQRGLPLTHPRPAQSVRRQRRAARHRSAHPGRPVRRHRRAQRLRQEHAAAADRRARHADRRQHRLRRATGCAGDVRVMFQEPRLLPWARVLANVEVGLGADRGSPDARGARRRALVDVGLADARTTGRRCCPAGRSSASRWPARWSAGRACWRFDEPLGALDALTRIEMQRLLERVWRDQGFTAILVTHDVAEAVALADRVLLIEDGRITNDVLIDLPRPRQRGSADLAALEGEILSSCSKAPTTILTCEAAMNARGSRSPHLVPAQDFRAAMRHLAGGVSVITAGSGAETQRADRDLGVVAVDRSADADRLHQSASVGLAADRTPSRLRRQCPCLRPDRDRRTVRRQGRPEGRSAVRRRATGRRG